MKFKRLYLLCIVTTIGISSMIGHASAKEMTNQTIFNFNQNDCGFNHIFSDYPNEKDVEEFYEFQFSHKDVPISNAGKGLYISGSNHSDDH